MRTVRARAGFGAALLFALSPAFGLAAESNDDNRVAVHITDAQTHAPIALVNVAISGPLSLSGITDERGVVVFANVRPGLYSGFAARRGYQPTQIRHLEVVPGNDVTVDLTLSKLLRVITSVVIKSSRKYSPDRTTTMAAGSVSGGSLENGLTLLPGLSLDPGQRDQQFVSLHGQDASQTALLADGLPLAPIGSAINLRILDLDVFDSASLENDVPASAGAINLHVPDPTLAFSYSGSARYGRYDNSATSMFARGTIGNIGYSLGHASNSMINALNGQIFLDQSGTSYPHDAGAQAVTNVLKVRVPVAATNVLNAVALISQYQSADYCTVLAGRVPCGFGPDNYSHQLLRSYQVRDSALIGQTSVSLSGFSSSAFGFDNQSMRLISKAPMPLQAFFRAQTTGATAEIHAPEKGIHTISFSATGISTMETGSALVGSLAASFPNETTSYESIGITDAMRLSNRLTGRFEVGNNASSAVASVYGKLALNWIPNAQDRATMSLESGAIVPAPRLNGGLLVPNAYQFDCVNHTAFGTAPTEGGNASERSGMTVGLSHAIGSADFQISAYRQIVHNATIQTYVDGLAINPSSFPPNYLMDISAFFGSPAGCGSPAQLSYEDLALSKYFQSTAVYQGGTVAARFALHGGFQLESYFALTAASVRDKIPHSTIIPDGQLPGVPLHTLGATLDWKSHDGSVESALAYKYVGANNRSTLPAYSTVDFGSIVHLRQGDLFLAGRNLFNQFGYTFGAPAFAQPQPRYQAAPLAEIAIPLAPRSWLIGYRFNIGAATPASGTSAATDAGLPTSTSFSLAPFPAVPPADPFAVNTNNPQCGPEIVGQAREALDGLREYVLSGKLVPFKKLPLGETATLRGLQNGGYALLIGGTRAAVQVAVFSCATMYAGTAESAAARGAYAPSVRDKGLYQMIFSPNIGLYLTLDSLQIVTRSATVLPLPSAPPANPFGLNPQAASCSSDIRGAATYVLAQLSSYFTSLDAGRATAAPDGISTTAHHSPALWYSLTFNDLAVRDAISACGIIHVGSTKQLESLGLSGDMSPALNYAPVLGLYQIGR